MSDFYQNEYPSYSVSWYNSNSDYADWKAPVRAARIAAIAQRFGLGVDAEVHEFGCAFGGTVQALGKMGFSATGTELNENAVEEGRARGNMRIFAEDSVSFLRRQSIRPQVIFSYHAIEHFTDPFTFIGNLKNELTDDGIIVLVAPSSAAKFALVYGLMRYEWFGHPEHLHLFSPGSAPGLAERTGMDLLEVSTNEFGLRPDFTRIALDQESKAAYALRAGNSSPMGEELTIVLTRRGGTVSRKYAAQIEAARTMCENFATIEQAAMEANKYDLKDPASL